MKTMTSTKLLLALPFLGVGAFLAGCAAPPPPEPVHIHHYHTVYRQAPSTSPSDATVVNQYDRQSR